VVEQPIVSNRPVWPKRLVFLAGALLMSPDFFSGAFCHLAGIGGQIGIVETCGDGAFHAAPLFSRRASCHA